MSIFIKIAIMTAALCGNIVFAQNIKWGVDEMFGIHYNTADPYSYKTPVGDFAAGVHVTFLNTWSEDAVYFNFRLTMGNDHEIYTLYPGCTLNISFRDVVSSFQFAKMIKDKVHVYAGLNFSLNTVNTIRVRYGGNVFFDSGEKAPYLETIITKEVRRINAGLETGILYAVGERFNIGLHANYYIKKRLAEDVDIAPPGATQKTNINFRPIALRMLCTFEIGGVKS